MWWGGEDEEPTSGGSSSANTTPPVDIMAEEAFADESTTDDVSDISDLKEQFAAQENLLGHLKSVLRSNEDKLQIKEKEVQDYAIRLAKAKRGRMSSPLMKSADSVLATSSPMFVPSSSSMSSISGPGGGKFSLLRQQLAEERVKENEELKSRQGLEEMVKQLQKELSERDALINQLEQMSVASFQTSPIHSPYVMSPGTTSPGDRSPDRTPPLGCSLDSTSSYFTSHYKSMQVDKDNKIIELTEKNIELERKLLDMEENLRAKDELVRARTAAVTLMSADLSAKGKSTLDQLEDTRTEMRKMQANFAEQEAKWREKNSCLQVELENRDAKIASIEENLQRMDKVRFELSTKNAELQEKLVGLQTTLAEVREQREQESLANFAFEEKMKEKMIGMERSLEMAEKTRNDRKEEFIESIGKLVNDEELSGKLVELENQLTELEEDKGNLQLKLVDYEEIVNSEKLARNELRSLNEQLKAVSAELTEAKSNGEAVTKENQELISAIQDRDEQVMNFSQKLDQVLEKNAELSLSKVKLEMKAVELEEIKDRLEEEHQELVGNIAESRKYSEETCKSLMEIQKAHSALNEKMAALQEEHKKCQNSQRIHDEDMLEKAELIKEQKVALSQLEKVLHDKTEEMSDLLVATEQNKEQRAKDVDEIQKLNDIITSRDEKILELSALLDENQVHEKMNHLKAEIQRLETELNQATNDNVGLGQDLESAKNEIKALNENLETKLQAEHEFESKIQLLEQKCQEYESRIHEIQADFNQTQANCDEKDAKLEEQVDLLLQKSKQLQEMENEMLNKTDEIESLNEALESHKSELNALRLSHSESEVESVNKQAALNELQSKLSDQSSLLDKVQLEKDELQDQVSQLEADKQELEDEKQKISEKLTTLREKAKTYVAKIKQLQAKLESSQESSALEDVKESQIKALEEQLKEKQETILSLEDKLLALKTEKLEAKEEELSSASNEQVQELTERLSQTAEELAKLQDENKSQIEAFEEQLKAKEDLISSLEVEVAKLTEKSETFEEPSTAQIELLESSIYDLKETLSQKSEEIVELQTLNETLKDENQSKDLELQSFIETCSGLNGQLSTLSQDLSDLAQEKTELEAQLEQMNRDNEDQQEQSKMKISELNELVKSKDTEIEEMKQKVEKSLAKVKSVQSNYDSLVANQGDSKELIQERDKAKAKCDLLTDKFKKVLAKCKQQEDIVKEHDKLLAKIETLETEVKTKTEEHVECLAKLETLEAEVKTKTLAHDKCLAKLDTLELEVKNKAEELSDLENKIDEMTLSKDNEIELKDSEIMEKEVEIQEKTAEVQSKQREIDEALGKIQDLEASIEAVQQELQSSMAKNEAMQEAIKTMENQASNDADIEDLKAQLQQRLEESNELETKFNQTSKELDSLKLDHSLKVSELEQKLSEKENDASEKDDILETLRNDLSRIREEMKDATINKNKLIEEAHAKLKTQEDEMESSRLKIIELTSQVEQCREQKLADDMSLASVNDTVNILQSQLAERDAEIAQLGNHIQETLGKSESCHAEKLQLKDQLDSLTIVAENLQSLQHQVHLKDIEIDQLKSEIEQLREELQQNRDNDNQNRPPPDITQYQGAAPDVASIQSQMQPDLMSGANPVHHSMDLVQDQGGNDGWDDDWNDNAGGANWFDNLAPVQVQDNVEPEPANEEEVQDVRDLQTALEAKEAECSALISEVDALVSVRETLEAKIEDLKTNNEEMQEKMAELESSLMTASTSTTQCIQCQPETKSTETSTVPFIDIPASTVQEDTSVQSPPPSVFTWNEESVSSPFDQDFFANTKPDDASDFFNQPQAAPDVFSAVQAPSVPIQKDDSMEKIKDLELKIEELNSVILAKNAELSKVQDQVQDLESTKTMLEYRLNTNQQEESDIQEQVQKLNDKLRKVQYEKTMLEDQINQLPTMDAFTSLQNVNHELSEESSKLKERLQNYYSNEEYEAVKKSNEDLKMKLASIGESQNEDYERRLQELGNEVKTLRNQLAETESQIQVQVPAVTINEPVKSEEEPVNTASSFFDNVQADANALTAEASIEKGVSASSYFDAFGNDNEVEQAAETSVFEAIAGQEIHENVAAIASQEAQGSQETHENVAWYKSQLEQYQQAIVDWQAWSQSQVEETNRLKETLAFHEQNQQGNAEMDSLRAAVKAKEIEVEDLIETLDRVKAEKSDLEQEITDLTMRNQDLQKEEFMSTSQEGVDIVLFEETKQNFEENLEKLDKVTDELSTKIKELEDLAKEKEDLMQLQARLQNEILILKEESVKNQEKFENEKADIEHQKAEIEGHKMQLEMDLQATTSELFDLKSKLPDQNQIEELKFELEQKTSELNDMKAKLPDQDHIEQLKSELEQKTSELNDLKTQSEDQDQIEQLKSDIEQQKSILNDWNNWATQKTEEYNQLLEAYNQYVESYAKLTEEINRLTTENQELKKQSEEMKPEKPVEQESKVEEYNELLKTHEQLLQSYNEVQAKIQKLEETQVPPPTASSLFSSGNDDASKGWDVQEDDVFQNQGASTSEMDNQVLELETEISDLRQKIRQEQEDKEKLNEELNAAKVKHGKLTLKVKQLSKELQTRKSASPASSASAGFDDSLDKAIQNELNERAKNAEKALKEAQQQVKEMNVEKERLTNRIDTLEAGNERFLQLKENQDQEMVLLRQLHQEMQSKVGAFEWQLSEKDELIATLQEQVSIVSNAGGSSEMSDEIKLKSEVAGLRRNVAELESNCLMLQRQVEELESALMVVKTEKEDLASQLIDAQDKLDNMIEEIELLQNVQVQYDSLKLKLEHERSEKSENLDLNETMQQEILQLRTYIASLQNTTDHVGQDQQIMASLVFERNRVTQLQKDLQNKDETLRRLQLKLDSESELARVRHESGASSEVGRIMSNAENDLMMKNERLQYDLDKSVGERRALSQQMENWKRQLTEAQGGDQEEPDDEEDLRMQQEQAYRSVGALQLRVEELTLEVTKLLEERDTLQLRLSNVMRQYERHKESSSRASTACSTPVPFVDNVSEIKELKHKIDELSRLNYSLDVELQKERESRELMQAKLRLHGTPKRTYSQSTPTAAARSSQERESPGPVLHI